MRRSSWTVRLEASFMLEMWALPRGDDLGEGVSSDHTPINIHGEKGWYPGLKIGRKPLLVCKLWSVQGRFAQSGEGSHSHSLGTHSSDVFPLSRPSDPQCVCSFPSVSLTSGFLCWMHSQSFPYWLKISLLWIWRNFQQTLFPWWDWNLGLLDLDEGPKRNEFR